MLLISATIPDFEESEVIPIDFVSVKLAVAVELEPIGLP